MVSQWAFGACAHFREGEFAPEAMKKTPFDLTSKTLWYVVWGAMALVAAVSVLAPYSIFSEKYRFLSGVGLAAVGAIQLALGVTFLHRKEVALAAVVLFLFGIGQGGLRLPISGSPGGDFSAYYVAGNLASENPPGRLYYHELFPDGRIDSLVAASGWREIASHYGVSKSIPFVYPPFFAVLLKPLARFSYDGAYTLWSVVTVILTFASILISLSLGGKRVNIKLALILSVGLFSYYPFAQELLVGQVGSLILFSGAFGIWLLSRNCDWFSALCFAFATMIKITPIIAIPLLALHRKWKWLVTYGCWMVCLLLFSIRQAGWAAHAQFLHSVMPSVACGITTFGNVSIIAYVQDIFLGYVPMGATQSTLPPLTCTVSKAVALAVYVVIMVRFYLCRREQNLTRHLILMMLLSVTISPISWWHHYTIALLPFIYLWCRMEESNRDFLLLALVLIVGTNITGFALPLATNHLAQLILAAIVPCLTIALVYFRVPSEEPDVSVNETPSRESIRLGSVIPS